MPLDGANIKILTSTDTIYVVLMFGRISIDVIYDTNFQTKDIIYKPTDSYESTWIKNYTNKQALGYLHSKIVLPTGWNQVTLNTSTQLVGLKSGTLEIQFYINSDTTGYYTAQLPLKQSYTYRITVPYFLSTAPDGNQGFIDIRGNISYNVALGSTFTVTNISGTTNITYPATMRWRALFD